MEDSRQACKKQIIVEFDELRGVIHFTSHDKLFIDTPDKLACINEKLSKSLLKYSANQKLYMIIDFNVFLIDLDFADHIFPFLSTLCDNYLHPDGIIAYGHSVSRLSFKKNFKKLPQNQDHFFGTKEEAFSYLEQLLQSKKLEFTTEEINSSQIINDVIEVIPATPPQV